MTLQGYLACKKPPLRTTLPSACAWGPRGILGGWAFSYERGKPVVQVLAVRGTRRKCLELLDTHLSQIEYLLINTEVRVCS